MKLVKSILLLLPVLFSYTMYGQEMRIGANLEKGLGKSFDTELMLQGRYGEEDMSNYFSLVSQLGIEFTRYKYFDLGITARYKYLNEDKLAYYDINGDKRATADLGIKIPENIKRTTIKYRLRYQISHYDGDDYVNYIRNRVAVNYKVSKKFKSSFSYELFYNVEERRGDANRFKLGFDYKINDRLTLDNTFMIEQNLIPQRLDPNAKRLKYKYVLNAMLVIKI